MARPERPLISSAQTEKFVLCQEVEIIASAVASIHTHRLTKFAASWFRAGSQKFPQSHRDASGGETVCHGRHLHPRAHWKSGSSRKELGGLFS